MPKYNYKTILNTIAELLHPKAVIVNRTNFFPAKQLFWDRLVQVASGHLVLPAIYGAIKRKELEPFVPSDLLSYLLQIYNLNQKRNLSLLKQICFLSKIFKEQNINHVFLKGAAMLIFKPYDTVNERMVGDIDILIEAKDLKKAYHILLDVGFEPIPRKAKLTKGILKNIFFNIFSKAFIKKSRHLERIVHPSYLAAVELHGHLLGYKNELINADVVLKNKVQNHGGDWFPSKYYLWQHAILNWQYNNHAMFLNNMSIRTAMDVFYLEPKDLRDVLKTSNIASKHFYSLLSTYFDEYPTYFKNGKRLYQWQLKSRIFRKFYNYYKKIISLVISKITTLV